MSLSEGLKRTIARLAQGYSGPVLLYDADTIRSRIAAAKALEPNHHCQFLYAVKACPDAWVLRIACKAGLGFDVANRSELAAVLAAAPSLGIAKPFITASGPISSTVANDPAIDLWFRDGAQRDVPPTQKRFGVRIALPSGTPADGSRASHARFGISSDAPAVAELLADPKCIALHNHFAGQRSLDALIETGVSLSSLAPKPLDYLDLGGGLARLSVHEIEAALRAIREQLPMETRILLEPGSFWFVGAGYALARIIAREQLREGCTRLTLDISQDCHLRWSSPYPIAGGNLDSGVSILCGPTCHEGDVIGAFAMGADAPATMLLPPDILLFGGVDGYSAAWNCAFNGIAPATVSVHGDA